MSIEQKLRQIEKNFEKAGLSENRIRFIIVHYGNPTKEQDEKAIAEYKAHNPGWEDNDINYVSILLGSSKNVVG